MEEDIDISTKVIVVGNGQVGKTSMITRFAKGIFTNEYKKTLAVDFLEKKQYIPALGEHVNFLLWDTAGQEEYDAITRRYYKGAGAVIIAFSTTDRASFDAIPQWKKKVEDECGSIAMVLVQNKIDLIDQAVMTTEEVENMSRRLSLKLYRTCVKDNLYVNEVFEYLGEQYVRRGGEKAIGSGPVSSIGDINQSGASNNNIASTAAPSPSVDTGKTFTLAQPKTRRTGGKKKKFAGLCVVL
eukprot:GILK01000945.1.p1 GENE.GILK01000945.1~~GILK01000945.1.p1  ORF type:complete len:271 (-),score=41.62 GILK01000945.1:161-883(-)